MPALRKSPGEHKPENDPLEPWRHVSASADTILQRLARLKRCRERVDEIGAARVTSPLVPIGHTASSITEALRASGVDVSVEVSAVERAVHAHGMAGSAGDDPLALAGAIMAASHAMTAKIARGGANV